MVLRAENVSRRFLRQRKGSNVFYAVRGATLALAPGSLTELTGRSGSGKSTLLNLLAGLLEPTEGKVFLDGTDLYALEDGPRSRLRNQTLGVIPQGQTALGALTVLENVLLPGLLYGLPCPRERGEELLDQVGIAPLKNACPTELSGGELRRLAIARALALRPGILLADEPTGDLDDENTRTVLSLLRRSADEGLAVLLVTHEREAAGYADRHYRMDGGVLTED
ncbi:MAG: ATP-binding cassette domain-containing protein [Oscillospiraceae bacterium]|nr:ATP-binding cassette domain-containing protein [Oscillospiraceae bacterium]